MKPTGMPRRKSGGSLQPGKGLARHAALKPGDSWPRRVELVRFTSLERTSTPAAKKRQRDTGPSKDLKDKLKAERAKGKCERCGCRGRFDVHHRRGRKIGGTKRPEINSPENLLVLCRPCHADITVTKGNRADAEFEGLLIREDLRDPADVPVKLADGWFLLTNAGTRTPTTAPEVAA